MFFIKAIDLTWDVILQNNVWTDHLMQVNINNNNK